jgi:gliding motility-associated-like protein
MFAVKAITAEGCVSADTLQVVNVWSLPRVTLDKRSDLCAGTTRTLNAGSFAAYRWQDGSAAQTFTISDVGRYWVQVTNNNGCSGSDTVEVSTILPLPKDFLPSDTAICSYSTLTLQPERSFSVYKWDDGSLSNTITITKPGNYWLQVQDQKGCVGKDTIIVNPKQCMVGVYIPNTFTPNRDGKNDIFRALVFGPVKSFELSVYNRWGQLVFQTKDAQKGWNGRVQGSEQDSRVFAWVCTYQLEGAPKKIEKGTITLIR